MSIPLFFNNIKGRAGEHRERLIYMGVLVAVAGIAFYLGYVARAETHVAEAVAINCPANAYMDPLVIAEQGTKPKATAPTTASMSTGAYVASKNGTKYYPVACSGAKRIKEENKISFSTEAAARAAGLALAAGCQ